MRFHLLLLLFLSLWLTACGNGPDTDQAAETIIEESLLTPIEILSSDEFEAIRRQMLRDAEEE